MITPLMGAAVAVLLGRGAIVNQQARARSARAGQAARTRALERARRADVAPARPARPVPAADWQRLLAAGELRQVSRPVPDPGNPGRWLVLAGDPAGRLGRRQVLVVVNGAAEPDGSHTVHGLLVPAELRDPIAAAAWTHDDPTHPLRTTPAAYAGLAVRR